MKLLELIITTISRFVIIVFLVPFIFIFFKIPLEKFESSVLFGSVVALLIMWGIALIACYFVFAISKAQYQRIKRYFAVSISQPDTKVINNNPTTSGIKAATAKPNFKVASAKEAILSPEERFRKIKIWWSSQANSLPDPDENQAFDPPSSWLTKQNYHSLSLGKFKEKSGEEFAVNLLFNESIGAMAISVNDDLWPITVIFVNSHTGNVGTTYSYHERPELLIAYTPNFLTELTQNRLQKSDFWEHYRADFNADAQVESEEFIYKDDLKYWEYNWQTDMESAECYNTVVYSDITYNLKLISDMKKVIFEINESVDSST